MQCTFIDMKVWLLETVNSKVIDLQENNKVTINILLKVSNMSV